MSTAEETPQGAPLESKKECDWCRELIRIDALKCPHCSKWRKDIQEDINEQKKWKVCAIAFFVLAFSVVVGAERKGVWCEDFLGSVFGSGDVSLHLFLSSYSGWFVLFCIAGFITSVVKRNHYGKSVKRKTGGSLELSVWKI